VESVNMSIHLVRWAEVPPQPWRNGGGTTRELLAWPTSAAAGAWLLRVSVADITRDGPFSAFPGIHRVFAVLDGAGVELDFGDDRGGRGDRPESRLMRGLMRLAPGDGAVEFDGALAPGCHLRDGPTRDLNLMARQDLGQARMTPATAGQTWVSVGPWRGLYTHGGAGLATAAGRMELPPGTLAWTDDPSQSPWRLIEGANSWWLDVAAAPHGSAA
jgi:environmental stress-induced protein Ves